MEVFIFRLSPTLGGRSEVLKTKFNELLGHMLMLKEKEEAERDEKEVERYLNYQALKLSRPTNKEDTKGLEARRKFEESILPRKMRKGNKVLTPPKAKARKWDFEKDE